ncbi:MAG: 3-hydroxyacyl-ACP dehydratase [Bacteroidia bacterium]|nr:3-hydroxyacyl-ACP dehydratase [Bacteroidia bacterium]
MLLNHFFTIKNISNAEKYTINIELNPKHQVYQGHFPGNPVAPGVCLTQMVKETVEHIIGKKLTMVTGDNLKFTAILNPEVNKNVVMTLALKTKDNGLLQADSTVTDGETSFFSIKASFKEN